MSPRKRLKRSNSWPLLFSEEEELRSFVFPLDEMSGTWGDEQTLAFLSVLEEFLNANGTTWRNPGFEVLANMLNRLCCASYNINNLRNKFRNLKRIYKNRTVGTENVISMRSRLGERGWQRFLTIFEKIVNSAGSNFSDAELPSSSGTANASTEAAASSVNMTGSSPSIYETIQRLNTFRDLDAERYGIAAGAIVEKEGFRVSFMAIDTEERLVSFLDNYKIERSLRERQNATI